MPAPKYDGLPYARHLRRELQAINDSGRRQLIPASQPAASLATGSSFARPEQDNALWRAPGLLTERQRDQAAAAAVLVCGRLRDPDRVRSAARLAAGQRTYGSRSGSVGWGLAQGWAGIAVLFEHADRCRPGGGVG